MPQDSIKAEQLSVTPIASLVAYASINGAGYDHPIVYMVINNDTDGDLLISYDGVVDHDYLGRGDQRILMMPFLSGPNNKNCLFPAHKIIYAQALGTTGLVYVIAYYV